MPDVNTKIETLQNSSKDVRAAIAEWKCYTSLTRMVHHKPKELSITTTGTILLTVPIGFPEHYVSERLQTILELLIAKWLKL